MYTESYEFINNSKIISGNRALENIPIELKSYDSHRPFLITSPEIAESPLKKKFIQSFNDSDTTIGCFFHDTPSITRAALINELVVLYKQRGCDSIIALGNGSVINTAKALNAFLSEEKLSVFDKTDEIKFSSNLRPFFLVPVWDTSETDIQCSMKIDGRVMNSDSLFPELICIDNRMTNPRDSGISLSIGLSALTHAVEASMGGLNPMTDAYSYAAIQMIYDTLAEAAVGKITKGRAMKFLNGVMFSGIVLSNSEPGIAHNLGKALSEITGRDGGIIMGILLPLVLEFMEQKTGIKREGLLLPIAGMDVYAETPEEKRPALIRDYIRKLYKELNRIMPQSLKELNVTKESLSICAESAAEASRWELTKDDYLKILDHAYTGIPLQG